MPRLQTSVHVAYSPVGGGKTQAGIKCNNFWMSLLFSLFIMAFLMSLMNGTSNSNNNTNHPQHKEFQSGQAYINYTAVSVSHQNNNLPKGGSMKTTKKPFVQDSENVEIVLEEATDEMKDAKATKLAVEQKEIDTVTTKVTNQLRIGISKLFGNALSNDEVEEVATNVGKQIQYEATSSLKTKADTITNNEIQKLEDMVAKDEDIGYDETKIEKDIMVDQSYSITSINSQINTESDHVQENLPMRAMELEKLLLEERLSKKFGKRVKLVIDETNHELTTSSEDEELFHGLTSFNNHDVPSSTSTTSTKYGSSSTSAYGTSSSTSSSSSSPKYGSSTSSFSSSPYTTTKTTSSTFSGSATNPVTGTTASSKSTRTNTTTTLPIVGKNATIASTKKTNTATTTTSSTAGTFPVTTSSSSSSTKTTTTGKKSSKYLKSGNKKSGN